MAKRKGRLDAALNGPFFIDASIIRKMASQFKIVAWAKIEDAEVHTCQRDEDALGLTEYISGWCKRGYYVRTDRTPRQTKRYMATIDWLRVVLVKTNFDIRAVGYMIIRSDDVWFVTEHRYTLLMKHCLRKYSDEQFKHEFNKAVAQCKRNGQSKTSVSGQLTEETH